MIKNLLISLFIFSNIFGQKLSPIPTENGTKFFFKNLFSFEINKVAVAGTFNNWDKNINSCTFDSLNDYWTSTIQLTPNIEYHYKLVINDTLWITDPNAPDITEDEWRNGIIVPVNSDFIYLSDFYPPRNKRITNINPFYFFINSLDSKLLNNLDKSNFTIFIDNKIEKSDYDPKNKKIICLPDKNLSEGEHILEIKVKLNDKFSLIHSAKFFLDREKSKITTPDFYNNAVLYEIYVRKFSDSDSDGTGDLKGLINKLDYLDSLGINAIWLMPVNEGPTEHGYNVTDYYSIEKDYGKFEDFLKLIKECKKRKIKVLFDWVINHSDSKHPFFSDAVNNPKSKYSKWYQFTDSTNSNWSHFGIEKNMPKFNFENREVWNYFLKNLLFWMDPNGDGNFDDGIDGIRCDAAKEIPHTFWNFLRKEIKKINPDFLLLAEVWDGANYLIPFFEDEFDICFDYPFYYAMLNYFNKGENNAIERIINKQIQIYPDNFQMVRFLSNHDNHRPISLFDNDTTKFLQALVLIFTLPGTPLVYYGDELGFIGKTPPENVRQKIDWDNLNQFQNYIPVFYKQLISLRKSNPALSWKFNLKNKSLKFIQSKNDDVLIYLRRNNKSEFLIIINNSEKEINDLNIVEKSVNINKYQIVFSKSKFFNRNYLNIDSEKINLLPRDFIILKKKK